MFITFLVFFILYFLFVTCGRLSWLSVSFLLHVKYTLSYRIVSFWWLVVHCCRLCLVRCTAEGSSYVYSSCKVGIDSIANRWLQIPRQNHDVWTVMYAVPLAHRQTMQSAQFQGAAYRITARKTVKYDDSLTAGQPSWPPSDTHWLWLAFN